MKTRITSLLNIERPIIQGGLAHLAYFNLAAAVSEAGGLGQITAMSLDTPAQLKEEINHVRQKTSKPFGINFSTGRNRRPYDQMLEAAIEAEVPVITITGGNPKLILDRLKDTPIKTLVLIGSVRQAQKAEELGADAVIAVGQEGGGHIGKDDIGTLVLIPRVVDAVDIPVVASGGIGDGRGYMAAFALGAEGIEMGTRFIATQECIYAHSMYKQLILENDEHGTVVIKRSIGNPGRVINTPLVQKILDIEVKQPTYEDLKDFISGETNKKLACDGNVEDGFVWAGQVIGLIKDVPTVQDLFERMEKEAKEYLEHCAQSFSY